MKYQTDELIPFRESIVNDLSSSVAALNKEEFQVRQQLEYVSKYSEQEAFQCLETVESQRMIGHLGSLIIMSCRTNVLIERSKTMLTTGIQTPDFTLQDQSDKDKEVLELYDVWEGKEERCYGSGQDHVSY